MSDLLLVAFAFLVALGIFAVHNTVKSRKEEPIIDLNDIEALERYAGEGDDGNFA